MDKIIIIGNVGRDPEMKYTPSGQAILGPLPLPKTPPGALGILWGG